MEIKDINFCPSCGGVKLKRLKSIVKCNDCGTKIGITDKKIWYEHTIKNN